jgi:outer membrane protein assembly factor BamB/enterochelin esterase-like enzyme
MFSDGKKDVLVSLDADTGAEIWRVPVAPTYPGREGANDGPVSTPAIEGGSVFALGPRGDLLAVDLESGRAVWRRQLVEELEAALPHWGFGTSPLVTGELVIVLTGGAPDKAVTAFDRTTGVTVWRAGSDEASYQSPLLLRVDGERQLIVGGDRALHAFDPATGEQRWDYEHGSEGFYRRILNPVVIGDDKLLLTYRPDEAKLIGVSGEHETVWTTRYLKRNYATPVYHDGYVYGYGGSFLTCIDAQSGTLVWKSRPPGNGFPILVDGHLVVQTKNGSLHIVEATPEGYRERAALDLFSLLAWTPPSFAEGRIYSRDSFGEIAAVEIVPSDVAGGPQAPAVSRGRLPGSEFDHWVAETERSSDPESRVQRYLERQNAFPIIEGDYRVHIVYQGEVEDIALRADVLESGEELPLHRVAGTNLYYASFELEPDARIHYQFVRNLEEFIVDSRNPVQADALNYIGEVSVLFMPHSGRGTAATQRAGSRAGRLVEVPFATERVAVGGKTWGGEREVWVYLPPGYDDDETRRYPTLYVLYGKRMLETARMDAVLDRLVGKDIEPLIAVFVESISPYEYARSQREVHGRMIVEELIPLIDQRYRTMAQPSQRALLGADEGGYAAVELGVRYPSSFGRIAAMSVLPIGHGAERLLARLGPPPESPPQHFYVDWGRYDTRHAARRIDVRQFSRRLRERLDAFGYSVTGHEWNDGSDLAVWGLRSAEALRGLFPKKTTVH